MNAPSAALSIGDYQAPVPGRRYHRLAATMLSPRVVTAPVLFRQEVTQAASLRRRCRAAVGDAPTVPARSWAAARLDNAGRAGETGVSVPAPSACLAAR